MYAGIANANIYHSHLIYLPSTTSHPLLSKQKLGRDERQVLCLRYGINDGITRTVTLVASEMRQTKSWVRSQECRALRKLRRPWYEKRLKEHRESLSAAHGMPL